MRLRTPLTEDDARRLRAGECILLSGMVVTARDAAHKYLAKGGRPPLDLNVIYHCGPIVSRNRVVSAGPTTSMREEPYEAEVIAGFGVRAIIGKGGMGSRTQNALREHGCVYLAAVGGAGALIADRIRRVSSVFMRDELGDTEAFWAFEVEDLSLTVAQDTHGRSLYADVESDSLKRLEALIRQ